MSSLAAMSDDQLQQLVTAGQLSLETAAQVRASRGGGAELFPGQAARVAQGFAGADAAFGPSQGVSVSYGPAQNYSPKMPPPSAPVSPAPPAPPPAVVGPAPSAPAPSAPDPTVREDALRIQDKLEAGAGRVAGHAQQALKAQEAATAKAKTAIDDEAELQAQKAAEAANLAQQEALRQKATTDAFEKQKADRETHLQGVADELRTLEKDAASFKIDPDRKTSGFGGKILAGLAAGLGAYAAAWTGGRNTAADMVRAAIEDDIAAQRAELETKRGAVSAKGNELSALHQQFGDWQRAEDALRMRRAVEAKARIDSVLGEYAAPEAKAAAEKAKAQADAILAESSNRILQSADREQTQALLGAGSLAEKTMGIDRKGGAGGLAAPAGLRLIEGQTPTKEMTKKAAEIKGSADALRNAVERLKEIRTKAGAGGFEVMDRSLVNAGNSALADAITAYKDAKALGALDRGSLELAERVLGGDPTGVGFNMSRYEQLLKAIGQDTRSQLKPYGYEPDDAQTKPDDAQTKAARLGGTPAGG